MGAGKTGNGLKCKRSVWLSENRRAQKIVWWNNQVKGEVKRMEATWKEVLGDREEEAKERCLEVYKEKRMLKSDIKARRGS